MAYQQAGTGTVPDGISKPVQLSQLAQSAAAGASPSDPNLVSNVSMKPDRNPCFLVQLVLIEDSKMTGNLGWSRRSGEP